MINYRRADNITLAVFNDIIDYESQQAVWADLLYKDFVSRFGRADWEKYDMKVPAVSLIAEQGSLQGMAVCHPDDSFDMETGKRIAKNRLLARYYRILRNLIKEYDRRWHTQHTSLMGRNLRQLSKLGKITQLYEAEIAKSVF